MDNQYSYLGESIGMVEESVLGFEKLSKPNQCADKYCENNISMPVPTAYFLSFFSPRQTAESIQRRNENLEMLNFQNSNEEPDDIYNRRKKKVCDLISKEEEQLKLLQEIKVKQYSKYLALVDFVKFFCDIKSQVSNAKTDYYSNKTFCALKNATEDELRQITKVVQKMFESVTTFSKPGHIGSNSQNLRNSDRDERILQFLIIPRFLISKEKINRLARDEQLQKNFEFLVIYQCLGHYNNEANKKLPEEKQMVYVRQLLQKKDGRQKFKRICSINHGNKFLKSYGELYYQLYSKSLNYLKHLDNSIKKGKKFEAIKKDLEKMNIETDETVGNSSYTENESSHNNMYSFRSFKECLNKMEEEEQCLREQLRDSPISMELDGPIMSKSKIRKLMSEPIFEEIKKVQMRALHIRKSLTIPTPKTSTNIILIQPPKCAEL